LLPGSTDRGAWRERDNHRGLTHGFVVGTLNVFGPAWIVAVADGVHNEQADGGREDDCGGPFIDPQSEDRVGVVDAESFDEETDEGVARDVHREQPLACRAHPNQLKGPEYRKWT